jgi:hypothetical protein
MKHEKPSLIKVFMDQFARVHRPHFMDDKSCRGGESMKSGKPQGKHAGMMLINLPHLASVGIRVENSVLNFFASSTLGRLELIVLAESI